MKNGPPPSEIRCEAYNDDPARVGRVAKQMPDSAALDRTTAQLRSVAEPTRLRILIAVSIEPLCVCELATLLAMSMPAVSHHVRLLAEADLIKVKRTGKFACYSLTDSARSEPLWSAISRFTPEHAGGPA